MVNSFELHQPELNKNDLKHLKKSFKSGWISTSGKYINKFESQIVKTTNSKNVSCLINGTSALQISLLMSGAIKNTEVIVPTITFVSTINAIIYNNASPIFMDVDENFNLDENKTIEFIKKKTIIKNGYIINKLTKKKIVALLVVHVFGNAANFKKLFNFLKKLKVKIIEDAAESLGVKYKKSYFNGLHTGTIGDYGCLSFNGNKIVTSGGGGAILSKKKKIKKKIDYLITQAKSNSVNFVHDDIGFNYKISNLHASIGYSQIIRLKEFMRRKKKIFEFYKSYFGKSNKFYIMPNSENCLSNNWLNILRISKKNSLYIRNNLINRLIKKKINVRCVWKPNHLQKPFLKFQNYKISKALKLVNSSVCLPSSPQLTKKNLIYICGLINE